MAVVAAFVFVGLAFISVVLMIAYGNVREWGGVETALRMQTQPAPPEEQRYVFEGVTQVLPPDELLALQDAPHFVHAVPDPVSLREMLLNGEFARLEETFNAFQAAAESDPRRERWMKHAANSLEVRDPKVAAALDAWVAAYPDSAMPRLARGEYRVFLGWSIRGTAYSREVSNEQMMAFHDYLDRAEEDALAAVERNPRVIAAYSTLIIIAKARNDRKAIERYYQDAIATSPHSWYIRIRYLETLLPRWGGSHDAMLRFADESQQIAAVEPRVRIFYGSIPWDRGSVSPNPARKLAFANQALAYGEDAGFYVLRGRAFEGLHRMEEALADYQRATEIHPLNEEALGLLCGALAYVGRYEEAESRLAEARRLLPSSSSLAQSARYIKMVKRERGV